MLEIITQLMVEPEHGNAAQYRGDMEAYKAYKHKDRVACILMQSNMHTNAEQHEK